MAKRYLQNAKEELKKAGVMRDVGTYKDYKYVSSASGLAFRGALEALKALFLAKRVFKDSAEMNRNLKRHSVYFERLSKMNGLGKDRDRLLYLLEDVYDILHIGGYYRELRNKKAIDAGFESVAKIIRIVERHISPR